MVEELLELHQGPRANAIVLGCLALVSFIYLAAALNVIVPFYGYSVDGATHLLLLSFTTGLALFCECADPAAARSLGSLRTALASC